MSQNTTNTKKEMPKGMRYGESAFDIAYLLFDLVAAIVFFVRADGRTVFILYGFLTLCLGGGDAFHLIPRVQMHLSGPDENTTKKLGFIVLCLFPQNRWLSGDGDLRWSWYRNIPFLVTGILVIALFAISGNTYGYGLWKMCIAIALSFAFYLPVTVLAKKKPMVGALMLPKTLMYIWVLSMGLSLLA